MYPLTKKLLIVDDDASIRAVMKESLEAEAFDVSVARDPLEGLQFLKDNSVDLVISDLMMPEMNGTEFLAAIREAGHSCGFIMITAYGTIETAVEALKNGAFDFVTKPFSISQILSRIERFFEMQDLRQENTQLKRKLKEAAGSKSLIGESRVLQTIRNQISIVANSDVPVFIEGESGTGKEVIAEAIHNASARSERPFLKINCSAIPDTLIESTLFGHEKGAYTHAVKMSKGYFEEADGGTFLLDEVTEMPLNMQAKLLRVLQEGVISRVGSSREIKVDVRIIATSNRLVAQSVKDGSFRQDLYYRLNVFPLKVHPLRQRQGDIPILAAHFIDKNKQKYAYELKELSPEALEILKAHDWPGNIRELENVIERAILYSGDRTVITAEHLSFENSDEMPSEDGLDEVIMPISEMEKRLIYNTLKHTNNNRTQAAELLQISVRTLRNKLHEYEKDSAS